MIADPIDAIPTEPVKRKRGRPPGQTGLSDNPAAVRAREARARARAGAGAAPVKARKPSTPRRSGPKSLRVELVAMLTLGNMALVLSPLGTRPMGAVPGDPNLIRYGDELDAAEIDALAGAIDAQCQRSARFRKVVERFLTAGAGGQLVSVIGMIAVRRAARHGIAPEMLDPMLGAMLSGDGLSALGDMMPEQEPDTTPDPLTSEVPPERNPVSFEDM